MSSTYDQSDLYTIYRMFYMNASIDYVYSNLLALLAKLGGGAGLLMHVPPLCVADCHNLISCIQDRLDHLVSCDHTNYYGT